MVFNLIQDISYDLANQRRTYCRRDLGGGSPKAAGRTPDVLRYLICVGMGILYIFIWIPMVFNLIQDFSYDLANHRRAYCRRDLGGWSPKAAGRAPDVLRYFI